MAQSDEHSYCLLCLGETHNTATCKAFKGEREGRTAHLKAALWEKAQRFLTPRLKTRQKRRAPHRLHAPNRGSFGSLDIDSALTVSQFRQLFGIERSFSTLAPIGVKVVSIPIIIDVFLVDLASLKHHYNMHDMPPPWYPCDYMHAPETRRYCNEHSHSPTPYSRSSHREPRNDPTLEVEMASDIGSDFASVSSPEDAIGGHHSVSPLEELSSFADQIVWMARALDFKQYIIGTEDKRPPYAGSVYSRFGLVALPLLQGLEEVILAAWQHGVIQRLHHHLPDAWVVFTKL
ncbi:UNVERIFIED_CONTAM: hypothetical protein K2H54_066131 [Gekko kuhli]